MRDPEDVSRYDEELGKVTIGDEHRLLKRQDTEVNLHVFPANCPEVDRMLRFRDRLRGNAADRELYTDAKRKLAARKWKYMQQYADTKTEVIREIIARAEAAAG